MKPHTVSKLKYLTPLEVLELEERIKNALRSEFREAMMFEILLRTGMRSSELLLLRPMDMYPETQSLQVATVKGGKDRELPIPVELYRKLEAFATGPRDEHIFRIEHRTLLYHWHHFRTCQKKLHALRHTYAYNLYKRHKDLLLVKLALGHRSINSTMVYQEQFYNQSQMDRLLMVNF